MIVKIKKGATCNPNIVMVHEQEEAHDEGNISTEL